MTKHAVVARTVVSGTVVPGAAAPGVAGADDVIDLRDRPVTAPATPAHASRFVVDWAPPEH